jgi:hypothetical protein
MTANDGLQFMPEQDFISTHKPIAAFKGNLANNLTQCQKRVAGQTGRKSQYGKR